MSNLLKDNEKLMEEYDYSRNTNIDLNTITKGSQKKVWWICEKHHNWQSSVATRCAGHGCPYCSGNKILSGYNDLATINPELASEWHPIKNETQTPSMVSSTSHKKVWWLGKCGHEWQATGELSPEMVIGGSAKKVWWMCKRGHEWQASIASRASGKGCPICAGRQVLKGYNDLNTTNIELAKEWHPTKNGELLPSMVISGSARKVWWMCRRGHEWKASVHDRTKGRGCPVCSNKKLLSGFNDLKTLNPELAKEWHPTKNGELSPEMVIGGSAKKVWWMCKRGHEWQASIASRTSGRGCPICAKEMQTSFPEQAIFYYIKQIFPDAINSDNIAIGAELDIYIPSIKTAIEYDGFHWHKDNQFETRKNTICISKNIKLIRIREEGLNIFDDCICIVRNNCKNNSSLNSVIQKLLNLIDINLKTDIDVDRDYVQILELFMCNEKAKSLFAIYPEIAKEWHPTKNGKLSPNLISYGSKKLVWWLGECGHEWQASVGDRTSGNGCPYCSNRKILVGFNDLKTLNPELASEWHPTKNGDLSPSMISPKSSKKVWWLGKCGHEWQASINNRSNGSKCPYCSNRDISSGYNDLATLNPELAQEWHLTKNNELRPDMVSPKSNQEVWWYGKCGHEWQAKIEDRTNGNGCPICANKTIVYGINDLATMNPELAQEWHPTKNGKLTPEMVAQKSGKKIWWIGKCGHEWQASVYSRAIGRGCPFCSGKNVLKGFNDLKTLNPELAKEWHPTKNGELSPEMVIGGSTKKVWWIGKCGHEWQATVASRFSGTGCPICSGKQVLTGHNDLLSIKPELAKEWHTTKNGGLSPSMVTPSSHRKVWWKCKKGHEWQATIAHRSSGRNCPICSNRKVLIGYNDLKTTNPFLASEWHPTKNGELTPEMVTQKSGKKVWWMCKLGHEWQASIKNRTYGTGCPRCKNKNDKI